MGIEQGTPVVDSSFELPLNIDLPDLRLPRAFRVWTDFKLKYEPQVAVIGSLSVNQVVTLGDELSISIGQAIGIQIAPGQARGIDKKKMVALSESVSVV